VVVRTKRLATNAKSRVTDRSLLDCAKMSAMTQTPSWQWTEDHLLALQRQQTPERLDLEYKRAESLENTDAKKNEISKDVSAMANSAGGTLIYGVTEDKNARTMHVSGGIDPKVVAIEWLEQVINSRIQRRIDGVRINSIPLTTVDPGNVAYIVFVPQSTRAPHMAADHRFYKRLGTTTALMEEYEIRDVARRLESPDLSIELKLNGLPPVPDPTYDTSRVWLQMLLSNSSPEPAFYATIRLYVDNRLKIGQKTELSIQQRRTVLPDAVDARTDLVLHRLWAVPESKPLLESERFSIGSCELIREGSSGSYALRWEIRSPKMLTKTGVATLHWDRGVPDLQVHEE
jgi:hypothetical protein